MSFQIRFAKRFGPALIVSFIQGIVAYEKMADEVIADGATLEEYLFNRKSAEVIFAVEDGKEVGFALLFHNFSTFVGRSGLYLEDLFVWPEYRGKGYGKALLKKVIVKKESVRQSVALSSNTVVNGAAYTFGSMHSLQPQTFIKNWGLIHKVKRLWMPGSRMLEWNCMWRSRLCAG